MRSSPFFILAVLLLTATTAFAQNLTVEVTPQINTVEIPPEGGSFSFYVTVANHEPLPQQVTAWCLLTTPMGDQRNILLPVTFDLAAVQIQERYYTRFVPAASPVGNYVLTANIGIYPNTIWDSDQCTISKLNPPVWVARYSSPGNFGDGANSIALDSSGNVYVTGHYQGGGTDYDYATIKYNYAGQQQWVVRYNGPDNGWDYPTSLAVDGSGNVYVTGGSDGSWTYADYATIKYNSTGVQEWVARYNGPGNSSDGATSLAVDGSGNVYVTGESWGNGTAADYATVKYNSAGQQQWVARYDGTGNDDDCANSIGLDGFGNVCVTGSSHGSGSGRNYVTIKYNANGNMLWVDRYIGSWDDEAKSLTVESGGNVYVTGKSDGDYGTIKYDANGNRLWMARYNGPANINDEANSIALDSFGNVYVTGHSYSSWTGGDYATIKYDVDGNQLWVARYNGSGNYEDAARSLTVDSYGNVYVTGYSQGIWNNMDYTTIKYDSNGNQLWVARYNGPGNNFDAASSLALDTFGNVYVTGRSVGSRTDKDFCTIKYSATDLPNWQQPVATVFGAPLPAEYRLEQNYPNPFNPTTTISYQLPSRSQVKLEVFDVSGRLVTTLINGWREAGSHEVTFDGSGLAAGVYVYRLQVGEYTGVQKMVLLK
ncbi:MAG: SBBP repeat-containing protein [bacterium]|nr:SBBP repeat-containing protein [bacterium]